MSVEEAIGRRRSRREYADTALTQQELAQMLWAGQGITVRDKRVYRAAPSAGATYPLEVYPVVNTPGVEGLSDGIYRYRPDDHALDPLRTGSVGEDLQASAHTQSFVGAAPVTIAITARDERTTGQYGQRGRKRYVPMEAGHAAENMLLQAESLGLGAVPVGAFRDEAVRSVLGVSEKHRPLYLIPVGHQQ